MKYLPWIVLAVVVIGVVAFIIFKKKVSHDIPTYVAAPSADNAPAPVFQMGNYKI